jgi:hypothetical protein
MIMRFNRKYKFDLRGWWKESFRHSLAAKGIRTKHYFFMSKSGEELDKFFKSKNLPQYTSESISSRVRRNIKGNFLSGEEREKLNEDSAVRKAYEKRFQIDIFRRLAESDVTDEETAKAQLRAAKFAEDMMRLEREEKKEKLKTLLDLASDEKMRKNLEDAFKREILPYKMVIPEEKLEPYELPIKFPEEIIEQPSRESRDDLDQILETINKLGDKAKVDPDLTEDDRKNVLGKIDHTRELVKKIKKLKKLFDQKKKPKEFIVYGDAEKIMQEELKKPISDEAMRKTERLVAMNEAAKRQKAIEKFRKTHQWAKHYNAMKSRKPVFVRHEDIVWKKGNVVGFEKDKKLETGTIKNPRDNYWGYEVETS